MGVLFYKCLIENIYNDISDTVNSYQLTEIAR